MGARLGHGVHDGEQLILSLLDSADLEQHLLEGGAGGYIGRSHGVTRLRLRPRLRLTPRWETGACFSSGLREGWGRFYILQQTTTGHWDEDEELGQGLGQVGRLLLLNKDGSRKQAERSSAAQKRGEAQCSF